MRLLLLLPLSACFNFSPGASGQIEEPEDDAGPTGAVVTVRGSVVDFLTGTPVDIDALEGVDLVAGDISTDDASFSIVGVPVSSVFRLRARAAGYATGLSAVLSVGEADVIDVEVELVTQQLIDDVHTEAGNVTPNGGVIAARLGDVTTMNPVTGVSKAAFSQGDVVFLDGTLTADGAIPASTGAGIAFLANVDAGLHVLDSARPTEHFFDAPRTRVEANTVSIVNIRVGGSAPVVPAGLTFVEDIMPIFSARGCTNCHTGDGPGQPSFDLGGAEEDIYPRVVSRVDLNSPDNSLLLRRPSFEDPSDGHQVVFINQFDADYLKILGWVIDGAPE